MLTVVKAQHLYVLLRLKVKEEDNQSLKGVFYKEKIVKDVSYRIQIQKIATYDLDRKKNQFNFRQIIQKLQPIVIDYLSPHLYYFTIQVVCSNFLNLYGRYALWYETLCQFSPYRRNR